MHVFRQQMLDRDGQGENTPTEENASTVHVFISYAKADTWNIASDLSDRLNALPGVSAWWDKSLEPGAYWDAQIQREIDRCDLVIVLLSPDVNRREDGPKGRSFVMIELGYALDNKKPILPVMAQSTNIPLRLTGIQYIDLTANYENGMADIRNHVQARQAPVQAPASAPGQKSSPPPSSARPAAARSSSPAPASPRASVTVNRDRPAARPPAPTPPAEQVPFLSLLNPATQWRVLRMLFLEPQKLVKPPVAPEGKTAKTIAWVVAGMAWLAVLLAFVAAGTWTNAEEAGDVGYTLSGLAGTAVLLVPFWFLSGLFGYGRDNRVKWVVGITLWIGAGLFAAVVVPGAVEAGLLGWLLGAALVCVLAVTMALSGVLYPDWKPDLTWESMWQDMQRALFPRTLAGTIASAILLAVLLGVTFGLDSDVDDPGLMFSGAGLVMAGLLLVLWAIVNGFASLAIQAAYSANKSQRLGGTVLVGLLLAFVVLLLVALTSPF